MLRNNLQEQLDLISIQLSDSHHDIGESGFDHMLWGTVIPIATALHFFWVYLGYYNLIIFSWSLLTSLAGIFSFFYHHQKEKKVESKITKISKKLWSLVLFVGLSNFYISFLHSFSNFTWMPYVPDLVTSLAFFSMLLGIAYRIYGMISGYEFLQKIGISWIVAGFILFFLPKPFSYIFMAVITFLLEFIVGIYIFYHQKKMRKLL